MAAKTLDDGTFWLPSQFLTDDDDDTPFRNFKINNTTAALNLQNDDVASRAMFFPYMNSSPVESLVGSSETESDEEEHMAELTRRMTHSTIQLGLNNHHHHRTFASEQNPKGVFVSGSPQSTLSALGSGGKGSSPNGGVSKQRETWDLLRAAAGEVERMRLNEEEEALAYSFLRRKPSPIGFYTHQQLQQQQQPSLSPHQLQQIAQFRMLRQQQQQQMAKQQQECSVWGCGGGSCSSQRQSNNNYQMVPNNIGRNQNDVVSGLSQSAWPLLPKQQQQQQQQYGCGGGGVRAVFLGNPCGKKERNGTGVFLPRCVDTPTESRKKPACTTVLVPDRVAQALNLKLEGGVVGGYQQHQARFYGENVVGSSAGVPRNRSNYYGFTQQKRNVRPQAPPVNHEIRLPQEWTY